MLIVIIEDQTNIRENLKDIFELNDYKTIAVSNALDGLNVIYQNNPEMVVTDVMMPDMSGFEMVERLRSNSAYAHIPIIFLTAKTAFEDKMFGLNLGAVDYITKPFDVKELLQKVKNLTEFAVKQRIVSMVQPEALDVKSNDELFVEQLKELINMNLTNDKLDADFLAVKLNYSSSSIHKKIKNITQKSTNQFIREYKLDLAKQMILKPHANISEIAFNLGFNSLSYFSKSYKNYFGVSPKKKPSA
jgi:DNA-binding response OmpR family regulator